MREQHVASFLVFLCAHVQWLTCRLAWAAEGDFDSGPVPSEAGRRALLLLHGLLSPSADDVTPELHTSARNMKRLLDRMHRKALLENEEPTIEVGSPGPSYANPCQRE